MESQGAATSMYRHLTCRFHGVRTMRLSLKLASQLVLLALVACASRPASSERESPSTRRGAHARAAESSLL